MSLFGPTDAVIRAATAGLDRNTAAVKENTAAQIKRDGSLVKILAVLEAMARDVRGIKHRLTEPGPLRVFITGEFPMDTIQFKVSLPPLAEPNDVVMRELTVTIGAVSDVLSIPKTQTEVTGLSGDQDAAGNLSLVDIDDAGGRSAASTLDFVLLDTIPPPQPGALGIVVTGEIVGG